MTRLGRRPSTLELLADDLARHRRSGKADVDREQRDDRLELLPRHAVLDCPPDVAAQPVVDAALRDQRSDDDDAAVAQAELVVGPRAAGGVDRLLPEAGAVIRREPGGD